MKNLFFNYYRPSEDVIKSMWQECIFIFDANVLLNLYRYPKQSSDDLIKILKTINARVWLPNQAALEYHRNRLSVISSQKKKFNDVENVIQKSLSQMEADLNNLQLKKRHHFINPDALLTDIREKNNAFFEELKIQKGQHIDVFGLDEIRSELDDIFSNKVGEAYNQQNLDALFVIGKQRYLDKYPPGYMDEKDKGDEIYFHNSEKIIAKYGDLILWNQIIDKAKTDDKFKKIIFVTDDDKEDWWWIEYSSGEKRIGPRPELIAEIRDSAGVEEFYMYNSERFMAFANDALNLSISKDSIAQVKQLASSEETGLANNANNTIDRLLNNKDDKYNKIITSVFKNYAANSVFKWISETFGNSTRGEIFDYLSISDENNHASNFRILISENNVNYVMDNIINKFLENISLHGEGIDGFNLILVVKKYSIIDEVEKYIKANKRKEITFMIFVGFLNGSDGEVFEPTKTYLM